MDDDYDDDPDVLEELPLLDTEDERDRWAEILLEQTEESMGGTLIRAVLVVDGKNNMVVRFIYPDGTEEVLDVEVRRIIATKTDDPSEHN